MAEEDNHRNKAGFASVRKRLIAGIAISIVFVAAEAVIGVLTGSLSLTSDAGHNAADTLAMGLALFAVYMMARRPTPRRTYGYGRAGILTALANAVGLLAIAVFLSYESIRRIIDIEKVSGTAILTVAAVAFVVNTAVALLLYDHRHDLNIKSAFLHMVADAGLSLGVVVAGVVILLTGWYYADPLAALAICVFILYAAWGIIRDATDVLLESVPRHLDIARIQRAMESVGGVEAVHHLHVWEIGSGVYALSGHVEIEDQPLSHCSGIMSDINGVLLDKFNIVHPTLQMECMTCPPGAVQANRGTGPERGSPSD